MERETKRAHRGNSPQFETSRESVEDRLQVRIERGNLHLCFVCTYSDTYIHTSMLGCIYSHNLT